MVHTLSCGVGSCSFFSFTRAQVRELMNAKLDGKVSVAGRQALDEQIEKIVGPDVAAYIRSNGIKFVQKASTARN